MLHSDGPMKTRIPGRLALPLLIAHAAAAFAVEPTTAPANTVRIAAAQAARRVIDFRLKSEEALAAVERNLAELERIVDKAGASKCDALVLPEDTPGLLNWVGANETLAKEVLPKAVYFRRAAEVAFYEDFFAAVEQVVPWSTALIQHAYTEACDAGLSGFDALHMAAAKSCGAEEFITTERPTKPLFRVTGIVVTSIVVP